MRVPGRILLLDSDRSRRRRLEGVLAGGFEPVVCADDAATAMASGEAPAAVVAVNAAPALEGWANCRQIRASGDVGWRRVPILVLSADMTGDEVGRITAEAGGDLALPLAGDPAEIADALMKVLERQLETDAAPGYWAGGENYRSLIHSMLDGMAVHEMIVDADGEAVDYRFLFVNPAFETITGLQAADLVGSTVLEVLPATEAHWIARYGSVVRTGRPLRFESYHGALGRHFDVLAFRSAPGQFTCVFRDITQRKAQEAELSRLTRIYAFLSQVNQTIVRAASPEELCASICQVAVEQGGFAWAWIGQVCEETDAVQTLASAGAEPRAHGTPCSSCPAVKGVIDSVQPASCWMAGSGPAVPEACVAAPIVCHGRVRGVLTLVSPDLGLLDSKEYTLLETVSRDISFALEKFEAEARERQAEEKLRKSELLHRSLFEYANDGLFLASPGADPMRGPFVAVNGVACERLGYTREELLRMCPADIDINGAAPAAPGLAERLRTKRQATFETLHVTKDGRVLPVEINVRYLDVDGEELALSIVRDISERKRVEEELRASQERYGLIVENIADVVWTLDLNTLCMTYTSPSVVRLRGFTSAELANAPLSQSLTPESYQRALQVIEERLERIRLGLDPPDFSWADEFDLVSKDGDPIPVEVVTRPIIRPDGTIREVVGVTRSIQERRRAQQALRDSEEKFRLAFMVGADAFTVVDADTGIIKEVNDRFSEIFGYSRPEVIGRTALELGLYANADDRAAIFERLRAVGSVFNFEATGRRKNGEAFPGLISMNELRLGDEHLAIVAVRDITDRKQGELALRRSEEKFLKLFHSSPIIAVLTRLEDGMVVDVNEAFEQATGFDREEAIGRTALELGLWVHISDRAAVREALQTSGSAASREMQIGRKGGGNLSAIYSATVIDIDGVPHVLSAALDVTERRRAEAEKARLEEQLQQAQKLESIGRLAGGVAHDFNNLLTVINGYTAMTLSTLRADDPSRAAMAEVLAAGERAKGLVRQLLAFGRKQMLHPEVLNLNAIVADLAKMLARLVGEDIELITRLEPQLRPVKADRHQMEQVLMNLATNARDAMPSGGMLTIETANDPEGEVRITVRDTGVGIPDEVRAHLFEPFFTTKPVGKGTGLGLAMVHGIVSQSGGRVTVDARAGSGSAFHVHLPAVIGEVPMARPVRLSSGSDGNETILVVEDQADVRKLVSAVLANRGYRVLTADCGERALALCGTEPIDLLLTDYLMPRMNGDALARQVLADKPDVKVLMMSGYAENYGQGERSREPFPFLQKPFQPDALAARVREVLGPRKPLARVLVTDDEPGVRAFLCSVFRRAGYDVSEAGDGRKAMQALAASPADLLITDLVMPDCEGIETIRVARKEHPHMGIIAISGASPGAYLQVALALGADASLSKPFDADAILAEARRVLARRRSK